MQPPIEQYEHQDLTVTIHRDADAPNPRTEFDNLGTVVGWRNPGYCLGDEQLSTDTRSPEKIVAEMIEYGDARVILPIHFHPEERDLTVSPPDSEAFENCDGVIYVTAATLRKRYGLKRLSRQAIRNANARLQAEIAEYGAYLTGSVFGFVIEYDGEHLDSCWGFYQLDYCEAQARESAGYQATRLAMDAAEAHDWACRGCLTVQPA